VNRLQPLTEYCLLLRPRPSGITAGLYACVISLSMIK
jgi:hypothetical protein